MDKYSLEKATMDMLKKYARQLEQHLVFVRDAELRGDAQHSAISFAAELAATIRIDIEKMVIGEYDGGSTILYDDIPF